MKKSPAPQGEREDVMTLLIVVVVLVIVALGVGYRYDRKHRSLGGSSGGVIGGARRQTNLEGKEKGARWGAGGGG
jgi:hypothetical protein